MRSSWAVVSEIRMSSFFIKQKSAYEVRISDWSSDVCSSDLLKLPPSKQGKNSAEDCVIFETYLDVVGALRASGLQAAVVFLSSNKAEYQEIGRASCRERGCQYV